MPAIPLTTNRWRSRILGENQNPRLLYSATFAGNSQNEFTEIGLESFSTLPVEFMTDVVSHHGDRFFNDVFHYRRTFNEYTESWRTNNYVLFANGNTPLSRVFDVPSGHIVAALASSVDVPGALSWPSEISSQRLGDLVGPYDPSINVAGPFQSDFSIWFLLVDLLQLPALIRDIGHLLAHRRNSPASTLKDLVDAGLVNPFAIQPLLADLRDLAKALDEFKAWLAAGSEGFAQERWRRNDLLAVPFLPRISPRNIVLPGCGNFLCRVTPKVFSNQHGRNLRYKFVSPDLLTFLGRLKGFIDAFGVIDPSAIWDAVPWSFVLDWFLPLQSFFKGLDLGHIKIEIQCDEYCESVHSHSLHDVEILAHFAPSVLTDQATPADYVPQWRAVAELVQTSYIRKCFQPPVIPSVDPVDPKLKGLTSYRVYLSSLLLAQRVFRWNGIR